MKSGINNDNEELPRNEDYIEGRNRSEKRVNEKIMPSLLIKRRSMMMKHCLSHERMSQAVFYEMPSVQFPSSLFALNNNNNDKVFLN